ncbi:MAG TPA: hypothetical protein VGB39_05285, partial [Sphingomicrobium sp.]
MRRSNLFLVAALAASVFATSLRAANTPQTATPPTQSEIDAARKALADAEAEFKKTVDETTRAADLTRSLQNQQDVIAREAQNLYNQQESAQQTYTHSAARAAEAARALEAAQAFAAELAGKFDPQAARVQQAHMMIADARAQATDSFRASGEFVKITTDIETAQQQINDDMEDIVADLAEQPEFAALQEAAERAEANLRELRRASTFDPDALSAASKAWMAALTAVERAKDENFNADFFLRLARERMIALQHAKQVMVAKFERDLKADAGVVAAQAELVKELAAMKALERDLKQANADIEAAGRARDSLAQLLESSDQALVRTSQRLASLEAGSLQLEYDVSQAQTL